MKRNLLFWGAIAVALLLPPLCLAEEAWTLGFDATPQLIGANVSGMAVLPDGSTVSLERCSTAKSKIQYLLSRTDHHGNLMWVKYIGESRSKSTLEARNQPLLALSDGTFLLFLYVQGGFSPNCGSETWGCRMDSSGRAIWQRYYPISGPEGTHTFQVPSGRVFLSNPLGLLAELDTSSGGLLWQSNYLFNYPDPSTPWAPIELSIIKEEADGNLVCMGAPQEYPVPQDTPPFLIKLSATGVIQWAFQYKTMDPSYWPHLAIIAADDGGYWMAGNLSVPTGDVYGAVCKLDEQGNILWRSQYDELHELFSGYMDTPSGLFVAGFGLDTAYPNQNGLTGRIATNEETFWNLAQITMGDTGESSPGPSALLPKPGGGAMAIMWGQNSTGLASFKSDYAWPEGCFLPAPPPADSGHEFPLVKASVTVFQGTSMLSAACNTDEAFQDDDRLYGAVHFCGEPYPGVLSVTKLQKPFRLKVTGWHFDDGSVILVKGMKSPNTHYQGEIQNGNGRKKLVAGGDGLKALLPKGQSVTLTVQNPDGRESVGFTFAR